MQRGKLRKLALVHAREEAIAEYRDLPFPKTKFLFIGAVPNQPGTGVFYNLVKCKLELHPMEGFEEV